MYGNNDSLGQSAYYTAPGKHVHPPDDAISAQCRQRHVTGVWTSTCTVSRDSLTRHALIPFDCPTQYSPQTLSRTLQYHIGSLEHCYATALL